MQKTQKLGYRDDGLFGDCVTDPMEVAVYETRELGNVDVPRWLMKSHANELTENELTAMARIYDYPSQGYDATDEDIELMTSALKRILDGRDFCKWLCKSPGAVVDAYIAPYYDAAERLETAECSTYVIPADAIPLTDPDDPDGTLWAWSARHDTEPVRTMGMKNAIERERRHMAAELNALYGFH